MAVIRPEKVAKIAEIKELLSTSKCTILVDFCGLTVAQDTALRRKMREAGVHYNVVKNTLLRIAAQEVGIEGLEPSLEKNTAIAVAPEDPVAVAKIVCDFAKENKELKVKVGVLDGKVISADKTQSPGCSAAEGSFGCQTAWQHECSHLWLCQCTARYHPQRCIRTGCCTQTKRVRLMNRGRLHKAA